MRSLDGANCADLPAFVIDKYFNAHVRLQPLQAMAAKAICGNCVVMEQCRAEALEMTNLQRSGVIGGVNAVEIHRARRWRSYEQGITDRVPRGPRPPWLPMTEATHEQEQLRLSEDSDEPSDYQFDSDQRGGRAVIQTPPLPTTQPPKLRSPKPRPRSQRVDVPMDLPGANCAAMPPDLIDKYFNADALRDAAAAQVAMLVCSQCTVLDACFNQALSSSNVRKSGVIAGMGARELERGRTWLHYEAGGRPQQPRTPRPDWLARTPASERLDAIRADDDPSLPRPAAGADTGAAEPCAEPQR